MGKDKFKELSLRMDLLQKNYNNEINTAAFTVGNWELEHLFFTRTRMLIKKGITLAKALTLEYAYSHPEMEETELIKELPNITICDVFLTHITESLDNYLNSHDLGLEVEIQKELKQQFPNITYFDFRRIGSKMNLASKEIQQARLDIRQTLNEAIENVSVNSWNKVLTLQRQRMRLIELKGCFQKSKITNVTEATEKILRKEQPETQKVIHDLIVNTVDQKLKKKARSHSKKWKGGAKNQTLKPPHQGVKKTTSTAVQQTKKGTDTETSTVSSTPTPITQRHQENQNNQIKPAKHKIANTSTPTTKLNGKDQQKPKWKNKQSNKRRRRGNQEGANKGDSQKQRKKK